MAASAACTHAEAQLRARQHALLRRCAPSPLARPPRRRKLQRRAATPRRKRHAQQHAARGGRAANGHLGSSARREGLVQNSLLRVCSAAALLAAGRAPRCTPTRASSSCCRSG
jgi:hypothetical protein